MYSYTRYLGYLMHIIIYKSDMSSSTYKNVFITVTASLLFCYTLHGYLYRVFYCRSPYVMIWYLAHMRPAKPLASLRICKDSPESSLLAYTRCRIRWRFGLSVRSLKTFFLNSFLALLVRSAWTFNPSKPNRISRSYQLDQFISVLRVDGWYFSFLFQF